MTLTRRHLRGHDFYLDRWHRPAMLTRYVGRQRAQWMSLIDIDCCEYCHLCYEPVALIETKNVEAVQKAATVTKRLAERADLNAYLVEYLLVIDTPQCGDCGQPTASNGQDITAFWVTPLCGTQFARQEITPTKYANWLWKLRRGHWNECCPNPAAQQMLNYHPADAS